jgi:signal transduction histidine kinase
MSESKIEVFFLKNLLQITLIGVSIVLVSDIILTFYDANSVIIDVIILVAAIIAFTLLKFKKYKSSVLVITSVPLVAEFYQAFVSPNSIVPMTVILTIGFTFSVLLKGKVLWIMQIITLVGLICLFSIQAQTPELYLKANSNEVIASAITYIILYILVVFSAGTLKARYDSINQELKHVNHELTEKSSEIEAQNEELIQSQDKLYSLNQFLEQTVEERTEQILLQNEKLLKYAYTNAHEVRGPIARVLGLVQLSKVDPDLELPFIFEKIEHETNEIDSIISRINVELEKVGQ